MPARGVEGFGGFVSVYWLTACLCTCIPCVPRGTGTIKVLGVQWSCTSCTLNLTYVPHVPKGTL